ncbi:MAG: ribosome maturation factor RimP [Bdellovibrionales bacterium]
MQDWLEKVEKICHEVCTREGCYLYDLEFGGLGQGRTLRVFIDKEAGGGAGLEDCSNVSRGLNEALDQQGEDFIPGGPYHLEVSTPGIDRLLRKPWHFEKVVGKKIWVKTKAPLEAIGQVEDPGLKNAKQIESTLKEFKNETLVLENKKGDIQFPLNQVEKAKVVFEMTKKPKR